LCFSTYKCTLIGANKPPKGKPELPNPAIRDQIEDPGANCTAPFSEYADFCKVLGYWVSGVCWRSRNSCHDFRRCRSDPTSTTSSTST